MEGKSAPDMFSMSRPSRDIRASKNPKGSTSDSVSNLPSKKFQIRASVPSPRGPPASKKAKAGVETPAAAVSTSGQSKKSLQTGFGRDGKSSSNHSQIVAHRSKRAAENGGDVTLDALRPPKKRKISAVKDAVPPPTISSVAGQVINAKSDRYNGRDATAGPVASTGKSAPDYWLRKSKIDIGSNSGVKRRVPGEEFKSKFSHQIESGTSGTSNGFTEGAAGGAGPRERERKVEKRTLRPRPKPSAPKVKKRTRFHEVKLDESDGSRIVGRRIKVFWPLENKFFYGYVKAFSSSRKLQHKIVYDDKDEEWLRLQNEIFGIELLPGEVFGPAPVSSSTDGAAVASDTRDTDDANEGEMVGNELNADGVTIIANTKPVDGTSGRRIKPEGVYRRKRKGETATGEDEKLNQPLGAGRRVQDEKTSDGSVKVGKVDKRVDERAASTERKKTITREGDDGSRKKTEGKPARDEETRSSQGKGKKKVEGKSDFRTKGPSNDKHRGLFGHANANRFLGISSIRERRMHNSAVNAPDRGDKAMASQGTSNGRRKGLLGKERIRMGGGRFSSLQIRTRHSNLADMDSKKSLRNRTIRDNDRLVLAVKASGKRRHSGESLPRKSGSSTPDAKKSGKQTLVEDANEADKDKTAVGSNHGSIARLWKQSEMSSSSKLEALGPFEAVMDAYREALSGSTDAISSANCGAEEDSFAEAVREDDAASSGSDSLRLRGRGRSEDLSRGRDLADGSVDEIGSENRLKGELDENDLLREESSTDKEGPRIGEDDASATLVPSTSARPEFENPKVYRRLKKFQPDKVYRRLKGTGAKAASSKAIEPAARPFTDSLGHFPPSVASLSKLSPASEVFAEFSSIAALGSCALTSFGRIALYGLQVQCGGAADHRLQLGTFYGVPSVCSLLRVSWSSAQRLRFLSFMLESVAGVERQSSAESMLSVGAVRTSESRHLSVSRYRFKRQGVSRLNGSQLATAFRQCLDPTTDLKLLLPSRLRFHARLDGLLRRARRIRIPGSSPLLALGASPRRLAAPPVLDEVDQSVVMIVGNLTLPCEPAPGDLCSGQCLLSSRAQWRTPTWCNLWISTRGSSYPYVAPVSVSKANFRSRSRSLDPHFERQRKSYCTAVGPYYGRPSLQSFLTASVSGSLAPHPSTTAMHQSSGEDDPLDLTKSPQVAEKSVEADVEPTHDNDQGASPCQLQAPGDRHEGTDLVLPSREDDSVVHIPAVSTSERSLVTGPWCIDVAKFRDTDWSGLFCSGSVYRGSVPRPFGESAEVAPSDAPLALPANLFSRRRVHGRYGVDEGFLKVSANQVDHLEVRCPRSTPGTSDGGDSSEPAPSSIHDSNREPGQSGDIDSIGKMIGAHYGSPSILSLLRVSKDFLVKLLSVHGESLQPQEGLSIPAVDFSARYSGPSQSRVGLINDDDEVSDQDDRMLHSLGGEEARDDGSGGGQEPTVLTGDDSDSVKTTSGSFGSMTKGRRTGKVLKRGFSQVYGDWLGREGMLEDEVLSGKPTPKRVREDVEISVTETGESVADPPVPSDDADGRSSVAILPPPSQDKQKASPPLPRMNVLKLRRCPTNKGVWLVAGNSCESGPRAGGTDGESGPTDIRDSTAGRGDSSNSSLDANRKRPLDRSLDSISVGRIEGNGIPPTSASGGVGLGKGVMHPDLPDPVSASSGLRSLKPFPPGSSPEVWYDCGIASINGNFPDGMETRKRRKKGPSPIAGDEGFSEHSTRRAPDYSWGVCSANLLITKSDRCIRETGAVVELQSSHSSGCVLKVFIRGESKFAVKADQPIPAGTTNKYTHSMMWRGGKSWSLEFVERKQWQMFKDMHEECFQRNARAASVRHIPIPGVKAIEDGPKLGIRFYRPPKYIRQVDGEAEAACASSRVVYDMDSEDEDWLSHMNNEKAIARGTRLRPKVDEDTLERVIDRLEKSCFVRHDDFISPDAAVELCQTLGSQDAIRAVYSHWLEKRQRKGMALVRYFQPAPWEQYQQQVHDWQAKLDDLQEQSPTATKQQLQSVLKRPPLFAFCLRPRGLENRNKMQKQRSQRKQGLGGSSSRQWTVAGTPTDFYLDSPSKRHAGESGGGFYGTRKFARQRLQEDVSPDSTAVDLTDSFNALADEEMTPSTDATRATPLNRSGLTFPSVDTGSAVRVEIPQSTTGFNSRTKKLGRKAKKMKLITAAEESRRKRQLRAQEQAHENERYPADIDSPLLGVSHSNVEGTRDGSLLAQAIAAEAHAKAKRERATALRSHAQALHAIADAAMHKAVAAVIAADAMHVAERATDDGVDRPSLESFRNSNNSRQLHSDGAAGFPGGKDSLSRPWSRGEASGGGGGGATYGWRRGVNASGASNKVGSMVSSKGSSSNKPGVISDMDDALLPVASWSQELGAGLGTRLLQTGSEVSPSPQRQKYSPALVEGLANNKSPGRAAVRADGLVSLGRTRGESMMAMLTR